MRDKIIHYFWFGNNPKPEIVLKCIESWRKYLPDYEILEWNEDNFNVDIIPYTSKAYELKKWAFVSDYARFYVLKKFGGIYLDTDVELLKTIPNEIIEKKSFSCCEQTGYISPGLIYACEPNDKIVEEICSVYENIEFDLKNLRTVNMIVTDLLINKGYKKVDELQEVEGLTIYPSAYFCGFDIVIMEPNIVEETISIHHYAGTWVKKKFKIKIQQLLKKLIGKKNYKKLVLFIHRYRK